MNIFVSNLGFNMQDDSLRQLFASYGEVTSAKIITDRETGSSRGFGFIEMPDTTAANAAITALNNSSSNGRNINVAEARPKENKAGSGSYEKRTPRFY